MYCLIFWERGHILLLFKAQKAKDCLCSVSYQNFEKRSTLQIPTDFLHLWLTLTKGTIKLCIQHRLLCFGKWIQQALASPHVQL